MQAFLAEILMTGIGALSRATGCHIETIGYYEKLGLLPEPQRTNGGHRLYTQKHEKRLGFILKARGLGFTLDNTRELLSLSENNDRSCAEALDLVEDNLAVVNQKLAELQRIKDSLLLMSQDCKCCCSGAKAPDCTIVDALYQTPDKERYDHA